MKVQTLDEIWRENRALRAAQVATAKGHKRTQARHQRTAAKNLAAVELKLGAAKRENERLRLVLRRMEHAWSRLTHQADHPKPAPGKHTADRVSREAAMLDDRPLPRATE